MLQPEIAAPHEHDAWCCRQIVCGHIDFATTNLVVGALPIQQSNSEAVIFASGAVCQATMDIAPADPIEGY